MSEPLDTFLAAYSPEVRALALKVRELVLDVFPNAIEQVDPPARIIGYGFDRTYAGLVCAVAPQKSYVNLMFSRGTELPDPAGLLEGTGKRARHIKIRKAEDLASPAVRTLLEKAVNWKK